MGDHADIKTTMYCLHNKTPVESRRMKTRCIACLPLVAFVVAGCGSSNSSGASGSHASNHTIPSAKSAQSTSTPQSASGSSCPLTSEQVTHILGVHVSQFPGDPTPQGTCTFGTSINGGVDIDLTKPSLAVYPYPQSGQPSTLAALHQHLSELGEHGIVDHPEWGRGAFADITETTVLQIDIYIGSVHVLVFLPKPFAGDPRTIADGLGRLLAA
jgi:hypothetical protein